MVAELIIKKVKEGSHHALELFPKVLSAISSKKKISYRKGKIEVNMCTYTFKFCDVVRTFFLAVPASYTTANYIYS